MNKKDGKGKAEVAKEIMQARRTGDVHKSFCHLGNFCGVCARDLRDKVFVPTLMYGRETLLFPGSGKSKVRAKETDNLCSRLGIGRIDKG